MNIKKKILVVASHFDDAEIGCCGTIIKHKELGDYVYYAITSSDEYRTGRPSIRKKEQLQALKIMNIQPQNLFLFSYKEEIHDIIGELDPLKPDLVFTQYADDTHQDHQRASLIGQAIGRKRNITTLFYDSGSAYDFNPNVFSIISWPLKLKLLECYKSQIECGALKIDILEKKDAYWASLITNEMAAFAEGFVVRKMRWII